MVLISLHCRQQWWHVGMGRETNEQLATSTSWPADRSAISLGWCHLQSVCYVNISNDQSDKLSGGAQLHSAHAASFIPKLLQSVRIWKK